MIDVDTPRSPGWWMRRLAGKLIARRVHYEAMNAYFTNTAEIPIPSTKAVRDSYLRLMRLARTNYAELIVEVVRERMQPVGFRTGGASDELGDVEAQRIWQANSLDAESSEVHRASLSMGMGYVSVGPVDDDIGAPLITPEDPREMIVELDPGVAGGLAALKMFVDDIEGVERVYVYLPGEVWRAARPLTREGRPHPFSSMMRGWEWDDDNVDGAVSELRVAQVPVVAFPNRSRTCPLAEFETHLPLLNRINFQVLTRLEIATLQAFRQRGLKNAPMRDERGQAIDYSDVFDADPGAMWNLGAAEIWESGQVDLGPLRLAATDDVKELAFVTGTPLYRVSPDDANGSAEGASLKREALVAKASDRILQAGESWEQVMSLAFAFAGDEDRARLPALQSMWRRPEHFSMAERYDAASKAQAVGVPWRFVMREILDFTPDEITRMGVEPVRPANTFPPAAAFDAG